MTETPPKHAALDRPLCLVLFGGPGVGKGTQAEILRERLRVTHFSTGELFRQLMRDGATNDATRQALECINSGCLVPDPLVIEMVRIRLASMDPSQGLLLDGFPRTLPQAAALGPMLADWGLDLDAVLGFELPQAILIERLSGRRTCLSCGASYHVTNRPPAVRHVCDLCGGKLVQRSDDQPEAIHVRLDTYEMSTHPLIEYYKESGQLIPIPAQGTPEAVAARTLDLLAAHLA